MKPNEERHSRILIGTLRDYPVLHTLKIDAASLCGDNRCAASPQDMIDSLPSCLQSLSLIVDLRRGSKSSTTIVENNLWLPQLHILAKAAAMKLPCLKKLCCAAQRDGSLLRILR